MLFILDNPHGRIMPLLNAATFIQTVASYRLLWLHGRFGGGKTSLAFRLAEEFLKKGYRLVSNSNSIWNDELDRVQLISEDGSYHLRSVVLLDEGGLIFKNHKQIESIASYANKMDCIYLIPSFWPPTKSAQVVMCQPLFNFRAAGVPLTVYKWTVKLGHMEDKGHFFWWYPNEIFGVYSRQDPAGGEEEIVEFLIQRTEGYREAHNRNRLGNKVSDVVGEASEADRMEEISIRMEKANADFASLSKRGNRRR